MKPKRWEGLEEEILALVKEYFPDARRARGSGSVHGDGDVLGIPGVYIDAKDQSGTSGYTVKKTEWEKARQQAARQYPPKHAVIVTRNKEGSIVAHCDLDLLLLALSYIPDGTL